MSSPDDHRSSNMKGAKYQSTLNMLAMLLPGATLSYYGEEIGLLEMAPDDDSITKYSSRLGQAVCHHTHLCLPSEISTVFSVQYFGNLYVSCMYFKHVERHPRLLYILLPVK